MTMNTSALAGIRILDLSRVLAAPFGAQILGDMGADVIKIERPGTGDDGRGYGFSFVKDKDGNNTQHSSFFVCCNRNKRSITVNLAKPEGQAIIKELAMSADVLIENYKVGDLKRFNLDYETLSALNPRLIYCSVTGFGQTGPSAARPGYDGLFQAQGGMMAVTGIGEGQPGAGPLKAGPSLVDLLTGHNTAIAVLSALMYRSQSGVGQYIDMALLDTSVAMVSHIMQDYLLSGDAPPRLGNGGNGGGPADLIECKDGIAYLTAGTDEHWRRLAVLMEMPELLTDPRFATSMMRGKQSRDALIAIICDWSRQFTTVEIVAKLDGAGIPVARYNALPDVWKDEQVKHRNLRVTTPHPVAAAGTVDLIGSPMAQMSASPATIRRPPPMLGEHTNEVLADLLGFGDEQISGLRDRGII